MRLHDKNNAVHLLVEGNSAKAIAGTNSIGLEKAAFFLDHEFALMRPAFRKSIQYLCKPFYDAFLKAKDKLLLALQKEPVRKSGTLILSGDASCTITIFYDVETKFDGKEMVADGRIAQFINVEGIPYPHLFFYSHIRNNEASTFQRLSDVKEDLNGHGTINEVLSLLLFIKFCPVETKIVAKGKKVKHVHVDYLNKTALPIEILDSTWFTTIVRNEGFSVGGHFRLQPFGPGLAEKKLIWIAPYEKTGYTRKAGVVRRNERNSS